MPTHQAPPTIWLISGAVLFLYAAAPVLAYLLCVINDRICAGATPTERQPTFVIALLSLVTQLLGVASLVLLSNALSTTMRYSMMLAPLVVVAERYVRAARGAADRSPAWAGLGGSAAGLATGALLFMRHALSSEPITRVTIPGDVKTIPVADLIHNDGSWAVSLDLVAFYAISVAIFFVVHSLLKKSEPKLLTCPEEKRAGRTALGAIVAFALNFLGVVALLLMARSSDVQLRLAMVIFPLFLIVESYWALLRAEPQNKRAHWTGLAGSSAGMLAAVVLLLRGAPLH